MIKRSWLFAVLAWAVCPGLAQAQDEPAWRPRVRLTPFVGVNPNFKQTGAAAVVTQSTFDTHEYELEYGSGLAAGATLDVRLLSFFSVLVGAVFAPRGAGELSDSHDNAVYQAAGTTYLMAKAGFAVRINEGRPAMQRRQLNASIFLGPAMIRDEAKDELFAPVSAANTAEHTGFNLAVVAELPLANERLAFTVGLEDWMISWDDSDNEAYMTRIGAYLEQVPGRTVVSLVADRSHLFVLHAGLSFRF